MDGEDALKKEEDRLMRAISRQGSVRAGAVKTAPKVSPKPTEPPKVTPPTSNRNSVTFTRSSSSIRSSLSADEQQKLELELQEQERKREEERKALDQLDSTHFKKKQHSKDFFDIDFKELDAENKTSSSSSNTNITTQVINNRIHYRS